MEPIDRNYSSDNEPQPEQMGLFWLIGAAIATVVLWQFPWGDYILYPFTILATWFHEMAHGLTAMFLGGDFQSLLIFPNGSGVASHSGSLFLGPIGRALVAAGGPMGPAVTGAALILSSRRHRNAHYALMFLGCFLMLSVLLWVRSLFGIIAISLWGLTLIWMSLKTSPWWQGWMIQFMGVQAIVSVYHQVDYLFMNRVVIGGQQMFSDTGQIAQQLFLPHWFWAILIVIASCWLLVQSLRFAYDL
jgi:hypothetical protein